MHSPRSSSARSADPRSRWARRSPGRWQTAAVALSAPAAASATGLPWHFPPSHLLEGPVAFVHFRRSTHPGVVVRRWRLRPSSRGFCHDHLFWSLYRLFLLSPLSRSRPSCVCPFPAAPRHSRPPCPFFLCPRHHRPSPFPHFYLVQAYFPHSCPFSFGSSSPPHSSARSLLRPSLRHGPRRGRSSQRPPPLPSARLRPSFAAHSCSLAGPRLRHHLARRPSPNYASVSSSRDLHSAPSTLNTFPARHSAHTLLC